MPSYALPDLLSILIAAILVLFLPGWAWQAWFVRGQRDPLESLGEAAGISVAVTAVFALLAFLLHLRLTAGWMAGLYGLLLLLTIAGWLRNPAHNLRGLLPGLGAGVFFALVVAWRLYQARELALPAWVDSVHHTLIVRVFLERGGLTPDLLPYIPVPLSYHYAFHALTAAFTFWSGLSLDRAVLVFGQIVNAAVALSVYRLGRAVWGDWKRALGAALLVAFFAHMPAYYLTWGRYTLLTGLVVLPVAMAAALETSRKQSGRGSWAMLALLTAGTLLAHYLAAILLAVFYVILGVERLWGDLRRRRPDWEVWRPLLLGAGLGLLLAAPWLLRVWQFSRWGFQLDLVVGANEPDQVYFGDYLNYLGYLLGPRRNYFLIGLGGLGLLLGLLRRPARTLAVWALFIGLQTLPWGVRLGPFRPDNLAIVWFLPLSLLGADLLVSAGEALGRKTSLRWGVASAVFLALAFSAWGVKETRSVLNASTILTDAADVQAIRWIEAHTSPDARFWINVTPWMNGAYRGVDGGWWIQPLTGRGTLIPAAFYTFGMSDYVLMVNRWGDMASKTSTCGAELVQTVREAKLTYVYLHAGKGSLQPEALQDCAGFKLVYQVGGVWIFEVE